MAQVVGKSCALCGGRIGTAAEGGFCPACHAPVHARCVPRGARAEGSCAKCGAPAGAARVAAPAASATPRERGPRLASHGEVRLLAGVGIACSLALIVWWKDWLINGVPAPWLGYAVIPICLVMLAAPSLFRKRVARNLDGAALFTPPVPRGGRTSPDRTFEGTFKVPVFTPGEPPFPVRGEGRLTVSADGLEATGAAVANLSPLATILVVALILVAFAAMGLTAATGSAAWLTLLAVPLACLPFLKKRPPEPVTVAIPWANVHGFRQDAKGAVRIVVRGMRPKGEIVFVPADGTEPVVAAIEDQV